MNEKISHRFEELLKEGESLINSIPSLKRQTHASGPMETVSGELAYWVNTSEISRYRRWLNSAANLISHVVSEDSYYAKECTIIFDNEQLKRGVPSHSIQQTFGLLKSVKEEWGHGMLGQIEFNIAGATFDDFLDHAEEFHKGNKTIESSVLSSFVFEDTIKKICKKNGVETNGRKLDNLIDDLVKKDVLTQVKAKRAKSSAGVRNHALHAEWEKLDIKDIGAMIKNTREFIEEFL